MKRTETKEHFASLNELITHGDRLIRSGRGSSLVPLLKDLNLANIPRAKLEAVAFLHYRVGLFSRGLSALAPVIYPDKHLHQPATDLERATYAVLLIKLGSVSEALALLSSLPETCAVADLYRAFAEQAVWSYEAAIPHLRKYLRRPAISDYERAVAE